MRASNCKKTKLSYLNPIRFFLTMHCSTIQPSICFFKQPQSPYIYSPLFMNLNGTFLCGFLQWYYHHEPSCYLTNQNLIREKYKVHEDCCSGCSTRDKHWFITCSRGGGGCWRRNEKRKTKWECRVLGDLGPSQSQKLAHEMRLSLTLINSSSTPSTTDVG